MCNANPNANQLETSINQGIASQDQADAKAKAKEVAKAVQPEVTPKPEPTQLPKPAPEAKPPTAPKIVPIVKAPPQVSAAPPVKSMGGGDLVVPK